MATFGSSPFGSLPFGSPPASPPASPPGVGHYFPFRYFAARYFPSSYFDDGSVSSAPPASFLAAIRRTLFADDGFREAIPGGLWGREIPPGVPEPCGTCTIVSGPFERIGGRKAIRSGQIQITIYAPEARIAQDIADVASDLITDSQMEWRGGRTMYVSLTDPSSPAPPTAGVRGSTVQGETRLFDFQASGVL